MKAAGSRQKGSRLERKFAELIRRYGLDPKAQRRAFSGGVSMVRGYGDILTKLPFSFECKSQETMKFWQWWEQAEAQSSMAKPPVLVHSCNFRPIMVSMKAETFLDLLKEKEELKKEVR
jgi:Holliday junction resolvase